MRKILVLDACIRRERSRTRLLMERAIKTLGELHPDWQFEVLSLQDLGLSWFDEAALVSRDALLAEKAFDHPRFDYARQFRDAEGILVAAPFWDLSIPALLKVYIENISVDGITFACDETGMHGRCKSPWLLFLTTRGGIWKDSPMEQGTTYLKALCPFFGIDAFHEVHADGVDIQELEAEKIMEEALLAVDETVRGLV